MSAAGSATCVACQGGTVDYNFWLGGQDRENGTARVERKDRVPVGHAAKLLAEGCAQPVPGGGVLAARAEVFQIEIVFPTI